jgi:hypothetical protein
VSLGAGVCAPASELLTVNAPTRSATPAIAETKAILNVRTAVILHYLHIFLTMSLRMLRPPGKDFA